MRSNDSSGPSGCLDTSDLAAPGWLFVLPWSLRHIGGVNEVVKSLVAQFRAGGVFSPHLLVSSGQSESGGTAELELIKPHYLEIRSPLDRKRPIRGLLSFLYRLPYRCWALRRIIDRHNIRIINSHFPDLASLLFLFLKKLNLFKGKIILSFHLSDVRDALSTKGRERKLWGMLLRGADHIVVVSDDLAKDVLALESTVAAKMTTIYNGVDLALFAAAEHERRARSSVPNQAKTILSIGAFIPRKGHDVLVRAFGHVLGKMMDVRLVLVGGDGPEIEPIRRLINSMSLAHRVSIFKDVPHECIPAFLSEAQLFVLASREESFGLVVTEAAAAKVPVVCTGAKGLRELITDRETGRLVDIDDPIALADAIVEILTHSDEAQQMATKFHEYVKNNLTWGHTYQKYLQLAGDGGSHDFLAAELPKQ
jgi:glycosyltransferase involved in cell wall biosynthesis